MTQSLKHKRTRSLLVILMLLTLFITHDRQQPLPRAEAATFTVDTLVDESDGNFSPGDFSLREALQQANNLSGADVINIAPVIAGGTILLSQALGPLTVAGSVTINGNGITLDGGTTMQIMIISEPTATVVINGMNFQNGRVAGNGAAIHIPEGTLTINNSTFSGNQATITGGAIRIEWGTLMINNSTFSGNVASRGGAIANRYSRLTINNSTFSGNIAETVGGAIENFWGFLSVNNSMFTGNTSDSGGAIVTFSYQGIINRSTFTGNSAEYHSGGAISNLRALTIKNSTFSDNMARESGGALKSRGALLNSPSTLTIHSSTFKDNTAGDSTAISTATSQTITSSLLVNGNCDGVTIDGGNNLSYTATGCPGTETDPQLGLLQDNGGPTLTMLPAQDGPAVDAYTGPCNTAIDQRGLTRPQGPLCDIGATEQARSGVLAASANCNNENLDVIIAGDGPFNITASAGINTPVLGVGAGTTTINGPEKWDNLTVTETGGNAESINLGQFKCRSDERPVPLAPAQHEHTTNSFPTFSWLGITDAKNYRIFVFDTANAAARTVDIRQTSGGPTSMVLTTPLPNGRLFWRVRGRQNRVWSLWSIRFTLFKDPVLFDSESAIMPVPTIELAPPNQRATPLPTIAAPPATLPPPPNSR